VDTVESQNEMKITSPPGTRLPLLTGATGRVILSQIEKEKAKEIIQKKGLVRYTSKTVMDHRQFLREVEKVKEQGYAVDDEEYMTGVRAVAAPLVFPSSPPAALWVVGFTSSLDDPKMERIILEIRKMAQEISRSMKGNIR
jgi:DNA-binding IclR family transcriptional regulator